MQLLDVSLPDFQANLALDEALLDVADSDTSCATDVLRLWEFDRPVVVVGRASKIAEEVDQAFCEQNEIPILRRCSGGTAVTVGPGCLLFSLIMSTEQSSEMRDIDHVHQLVMGKVGGAIGALLGDVMFQGTCDLTWRNRKFSGNSLRIARRHVLYHGTLLYSFPLDFLHNTLRVPPRQPQYRDGRTHKNFVTNLPLDAHQLRSALIRAFDTQEIRTQWPKERTMELVETRYGKSEWHFRH